MRTSAFTKLPSERTLQPEVDAMFRSEVDNEEWKNYVVLLLDEMKVKESLVYDKYACG